MTYIEALANLEAAREAVFSVLRALEGHQRAEGIRKALEAGMGATELAKGLGISRARLYQLIGAERRVGPGWTRRAPNP